jgi:hypothetical protein
MDYTENTEQHGLYLIKKSSGISDVREFRA